MKKLMKRTALALVAAAALLGAIHGEEYLRGRGAYARWRSSQEAAGMSYDLAPYAPAPLPDGENFGAAPIVASAVRGESRPKTGPFPSEAFLAPRTAGNWLAGAGADWAAWNRDLAGEDLDTALQPWKADLDAWVEASRRPGCRLPIPYGREGDAAPMPALLGMRMVARMLRVRALGHLHAGRTEAAFQDTLAGLRMIRHLQREPHLITQLLRNAWVTLYFQPLWEGLADHAWTDAQLAAFQEELRPLDVLASQRTSWRFERALAPGLASTAGGGQVLASLLLGTDEPDKHPLARKALGVLLPRGWVYLNFRAMDETIARDLEPVLDPVAHRVRADLQRKALAHLNATAGRPWRRMPALYLPALFDQNVRIARNQAAIDMARIACGLERHRLSRRAYPASLADLAPAYLADLPSDIMNGQPYGYRLEGPAFRLWSVAWNGVDDGGLLAQDKASRALDPDKGDWVWFGYRPTPAGPGAPSVPGR